MPHQHNGESGMYRRTKGGIEIHGVITSHETSDVSSGQVNEPDGTTDGGDDHHADDDESTLDLVDDEDSREFDDDTDDTRRDLHENRVERVKTKTFGDQAPESAHASRRAGDAASPISS